MADLSAKKEEIRQRLIELRYPRRRAAVFAADPEHNPLILEDCSACHGLGTCCHADAGCARLEECEICLGRGITGRVVRYFAETSTEVRPIALAIGWVTCLWCERRFSVGDSAVWTGLRHVKCGGLIALTDL